MNYIKEIQRFEQYLLTEEKSAATIEKYLRDIRGFCSHLAGRRISKEETIAYKEYLTAEYSPASVNSMLIAINRFLRFLGLQDCCVRPLKIQRQIHPGGQGADKGRIPAAGESSKRHPAVVGDPDDLRHRYPGERAAIYHGRSGAGGQGGGELQK